MAGEPGVVTSMQNRRVAAARALRRAKERAATGTFLVEGPHAVAELVGSSAYGIGDVFVTADLAQRQPGLVDAVRARGGDVVFVDDRVADALAETVHPQGVVAVAARPELELSTVFRGRPNLVAVLDRVADPGNAGTVIRTADAFAADAVVLTGGSVDPYGGKCVRATAGSLFHLPVLTDVELAPVVDAARAAGLQVLAAAGDGDPLDALGDALGAPTCWVFGNEAHGLDATAPAWADRVVSIPQTGRAESLNLATAAAICLWSTAQHRR